MYSFDNKYNSYKYESIQHGYESLEYYDDEELDIVEISLEEMLESEDEIELEELAGAF